MSEQVKPMDHVRDIGRTYEDALKSYRSNLTADEKAEIRENWTLYTELVGMKGAKGADVAALGALLPIASLFETMSAEEVRQVVNLSILSHLDALMD